MDQYLTLKQTTKEVRDFVGIKSGDLVQITRNTLNRRSGLMITELYISSVKNLYHKYIYFSMYLLYIRYIFYIRFFYISNFVIIDR